MWLIIALLLKGFVGQHIIQVGEREFFGEDPVLTKMLLERTTVPSDAEISLQAMPKEYYDNKRLFEAKAKLHLNETRRFLHEPPKVEQKKRILELMQHNIYVTQYRMQHLKNITDKYSQHISFRVSVLFSRLDTLIREMRILYTYMNRTIERIYTFWSWLVGSWDGRKRPVHMHIVYYSHILKRNIDVTYLVEHMIAIHKNYMSKHFKIKITAPGTNSPDGGTQHTGPPKPPGPPNLGDSDPNEKPPGPGDQPGPGGPGAPPNGGPQGVGPQNGGPQGADPQGGGPQGGPQGNSPGGPQGNPQAQGPPPGGPPTF